MGCLVAGWYGPNFLSFRIGHSDLFVHTTD